jgi:hypothetical protein
MQPPEEPNVTATHTLSTGEVVYLDAVLATPPGGNDSGADTIRGYLVALLRELWAEGEGFSGKRPFGNSGWKWDLYAALVKAGFVVGTFDEDGYLEDLPRASQDDAEALIAAAIVRLGEPCP